MLAITMLLVRTRKDEGIQRCDPRYKNKVFVNSWYFQVWRIGSVLAHVSQLWCSRKCCVLKNPLRSRTRVAIVVFQNAWCFEQSAPFSHMCGNFCDQLRSGCTLACVYPAMCISYSFLRCASNIFLNLRFKHRGMKSNQFNHIKSNQFNQINSNQSINQSINQQINHIKSDHMKSIN